MSNFFHYEFLFFSLLNCNNNPVNFEWIPVNLLTYALSNHIFLSKIEESVTKKRDPDVS